MPAAICIDVLDVKRAVNMNTSLYIHWPVRVARGFGKCFLNTCAIGAKDGIFV